MPTWIKHKFISLSRPHYDPLPFITRKSNESTNQQQQKNTFTVIWHSIHLTSFLRLAQDVDFAAWEKQPDVHAFANIQQWRVTCVYFPICRYTFFTFLPRNLFEQFSRVANFYFLFMMGIALIPGLSPITPLTSVLPLLFVITVTGVKQGERIWGLPRNRPKIFFCFNMSLQYILLDFPLSLLC